MTMKKRILAAAVAILLSVGVAIPGVAQKKMQQFGVAFYNLENLFDTIPNNPKGYDEEFTPAGKNKWDGNKYWSKIHNLAYTISQMPTKFTPQGPAIIGVSEIENITVLEDLVADPQIKGWNLNIVHHDSPDNRGVDVGLLYNPKFFRVINTVNHRLSIDGMPKFKTRDQMCVVGLLGGVRTAVIVNHWPSRRGGEQQSSYLREAAAALTRQIADSLLNVDPKMSIIVMGDLNDDPMNKSVAEVLPGRRNEKDVAAGEFFNPFWKKLDDGIGSYTYRGGWNLFDQILVNYNLLKGVNGLKFQKAIVLNKEFLKQTDGQYKGYPLRTFAGGVWQNGYSDHFPTEIFLVREY